MRKLKESTKTPNHAIKVDEMQRYSFRKNLYQAEPERFRRLSQSVSCAKIGLNILFET